MPRHTITRGLKLPISGAPSSVIEDAATARHVALVAADYVGLRPTMHVAAGDSVRRGQLLFEDKTMPGVRYTAPAAGTVRAVNRGARRALQSVVIEQSRAEREGREPEAVDFHAYSGRHPSGMTEREVRDLLLESGQWTALRARPYGRVADPATRPHSIFVTAVDTSPLAPDMAVVLQGREGAFERGLAALARLTAGPVYVCTGPDQRAPSPPSVANQILHEVFDGVHPAGTVGVHIHTLDPVDRLKVVWHIGAQDVIATGRLFETGVLDPSRVVALGGPPVARPRLLRTRIGAETAALVNGDVHAATEHRVISGSVLSGRGAAGEVHGYLGRYHQQVSVLAEGREREFLGWLGPGFGTFSTIRSFASWLIPGRRFPMTTSTHGSPRAIVPIGMYERVMPMDLLPTPMLRALVMHDVERAEELGCLELDEEDVALCTFVDPGKTDFGPHLRRVLETLRTEG
ncbi:MAG: Na(+)-translocating NADH-quinone reductase subunit A [Acidobacteria bacterium]|nr:Na(+)-translocating NADH-quinone reductase subunit A [Acidobacteriota bacterium]MYH28888.1 Na(+)-translocating NADH-quinone reductase subunit A [Acidobacteriota bacterium]MYK87395.1 Na(+)-translocating NADH-quinone reductase subunit A [Acidobacteriota bacterium]